jgi:hypothetical protein
MERWCCVTGVISRLVEQRCTSRPWCGSGPEESTSESKSKRKHKRKSKSKSKSKRKSKSKSKSFNHRGHRGTQGTAEFVEKP